MAGNDAVPENFNSKGKLNINQETPKNGLNGAITGLNWESKFVLSEKKQYDKYEVKRIKVLMINHFKFYNYANRIGSLKDIKDLKEIFELTSKYNVTVLQDNENDKEDGLTKNKVFDETTKVVEKEMGEYDQLIVIISSHGNIKSIEAYDTPYKISDFLDILKHKNLDGKPKFIILSTCRVPEIRGKKLNDDCIYDLDLKDCLLVYGAYPGKIGTRNIEGTRLLRSFRVALRKLQEKNEERLVLDLLVDIKRHIAIIETLVENMSEPVYQIPMVTHNLTKHLYITSPWCGGMFHELPTYL